MSSVKKVLPARSEIDRVGIEFRSDIVSRAKYTYKKP